MLKRLTLAYGCLLSLIIFIVAPLASAQDTIDTALIAWHPDGQMIAVAYVDHIDIVDVSTMEILNTFDDLSNRKIEPIWNPDGDMLGFGNGTDFEIWLTPWDAQLAQQISVFDMSSQSTGSIVASSWNPNGTMIAISPGIFVNVLDLTTDTMTSLENVNSNNILDLGWDSSGEKLAVARIFNIAEIWNFSIQEIDLLIGLQAYLDSEGNFIVPTFFSIDWSPDNHKLVYGAEGIMQSFDLDKIPSDIRGATVDLLEDTIQYDVHEVDIFSVDWNPNGKLIASGGEDGTIRIWNAETGEQIQLIDLGDGIRVKSVAWSPDGTQLAYGGVNGELVIIDAPEIES